MKKGLIIIVGVGNSFGLSIAKIFGAQNYDIVLLGRSIKNLKKLVNDSVSDNIIIHTMEIDVSDSDSVKVAFRKIKELNKPVDLLIYNAVARRSKKPSELSVSESIDDFKINVGGAISCTNEVLSIFAKQGYGSIIYTGGGVAINPSINNASMSIGKAGLRNYAINLSNELIMSNIFVGTITITQRVEENTEYSPEKIAEQYYKMFLEKAENERIM